MIDPNLDNFSQNNDQEAQDRNLGRFVRTATGIGMVALGAAAGTFVALTGDYAGHTQHAGSILDRAFHITPDIMTAYIGSRLIRKH